MQRTRMDALERIAETTTRNIAELTKAVGDLTTAAEVERVERKNLERRVEEMAQEQDERVKRKWSLDLALLTMGVSLFCSIIGGVAINWLLHH